MKKLSLLAILFLAACSQGTKLKRQAPSNISDSFGIVTKSSVATAEAPADSSALGGNYLQIQKASLGKVFLMISSGRTGGATPQWLDLKPQVVSFQKDFAGKKLALMEENYNSVYSEIATDNLLQTFKIVAETDTTITFDWDQGLQSFETDGVFDTDVADPSAPADTDDGRQVMPVVDSYVKGLDFDQNNLEINQISKVRMDSLKPADDGKGIDDQTREQTLSMNIQIRAYQAPSESFSSKLADPDRRIGFFVTKLKKKGYSTGDQNWITKWDLDPSKGPITFLVSESVPKDYIQAASEGALYWNKVFGREVVVVKTGVDSQANPQNRTISLHWIEWLDAGAAYAQAQADPLTGEMLRGQIFMPSVFTQVGSGEQLGLNGGNPTASPVLNKTTACDISKKIMGVSVLSQEASDSQRLRLAQDSIRSTVAHEFGHALGLRHNFAGSFSAKASTADIYKAASTYLKDVNAPGLEGTTSIMDYVSGYDDVLTAAYIKHDGLSYDKMAMQWAYAKDDDSMVSEGISKFCTDEDIGFANAKNLQIYGCERFDNGNNPLQRKYLDTKDGKDALVKTLFVSIMGRLYPANQTDRADIDDTLKNTVQWAAVTTTNLKYVSQILMTSATSTPITGGFISLENAKAHVGKDYATQDPDLDAQVSADLKATGGYSAILNGLLRDQNGDLEIHWVAKQLADLEKTPAFSQGKTLGAKTYTLSALDQQKIVNFFNVNVIPANEKSIFYGLAPMIPTGDQILKSGILADGESAILAKLAIDINMLSEQSQKGHVGADLATEVNLPTKFYTDTERAYSLGLVSKKLINVTDNAVNAASVSQALATEINQVLLAAKPGLAVQNMSATDYQKTISDLTTQNLLDLNTLVWLTSEVTVYSQL